MPGSSQSADGAGPQSPWVFPSQFDAAFSAPGLAAGWAIGAAPPAPVAGVEPARHVGRSCPELVAGERPATAADRTLLWHDYETFGRCPATDQVAQYAAQRTDLELRPLGPPTTLLAQPTPDYLPNPGACLVHGLTPQHCARVGHPEWEFAGLVAAQVCAAGTVTIGYNNIAFDAGFTRALCWRNLLAGPDPRRGCGQLDLLDILRAVRCFAPDALHWPTRPDGSISLRLVDVAAANDVDPSGAHDALADVTATLQLARRVRAAAPELWGACSSRHDPSAVAATIGVAVERGEWLVGVSSGADRARGSLRFLLPVLIDPAPGGATACLDLGVAPEQVQEWLAGETRRGGLASSPPAWPEAPDRPPIRPLVWIRPGRAPMVFRATAGLAAWLASVWAIDLDQVRRQALAVRDVLPQLQAAAATPGPPTRVEGTERADDPFDPGPAGQIGPEEAAHLAPWRALAADPGLPVPGTAVDPRLRRVVALFQARHAAETLTDLQARDWELRRRERIRRLAQEYGYGQLLDDLEPAGTPWELRQCLIQHAHTLGWVSPDAQPGSAVNDRRRS